MGQIHRTYAPTARRRRRVVEAGIANPHQPRTAPARRWHRLHQPGLPAAAAPPPRYDLCGENIGGEERIPSPNGDSATQRNLAESVGKARALEEAGLADPQKGSSGNAPYRPN